MAELIKRMSSTPKVSSSNPETLKNFLHSGSFILKHFVIDSSQTVHERSVAKHERHKMFWTEQWRKWWRNGRGNVSKIKEPLYFTVLLSQVWNQHQDELVRLIARLTDKLGVVSSLLTAAKGERKPWNDPYSCIQEVLKLCFK